LDFVRKGLEGAALVRGGGGPVFLKLDNGREAEGGSSDLQLEDSNEVSGGGFCEVDNNRLRGNEGIRLLTDSFSEGGTGETLF
jgi:hypothetical protein